MDQRLPFKPPKTRGLDGRPRPEGGAVGLTAHLAMAVQHISQRTTALKRNLAAKAGPVQELICVGDLSIGTASS